MRLITIAALTIVLLTVVLSCESAPNAESAKKKNGDGKQKFDAKKEQGKPIDEKQKKDKKSTKSGKKETKPVEQEKEEPKAKTDKVVEEKAKPKREKVVDEKLKPKIEKIVEEKSAKAEKPKKDKKLDVKEPNLDVPNGENPGNEEHDAIVAKQDVLQETVNEMKTLIAELKDVRTASESVEAINDEANAAVEDKIAPEVTAQEQKAERKRQKMLKKAAQKLLNNEIAKAKQEAAALQMQQMPQEQPTVVETSLTDLAVELESEIEHIRQLKLQQKYPTLTPEQIAELYDSRTAQKLQSKYPTFTAEQIAELMEAKAAQKAQSKSPTLTVEQINELQTIKAAQKLQNKYPTLTPEQIAEIEAIKAAQKLKNKYPTLTPEQIAELQNIKAAQKEVKHLLKRIGPAQYKVLQRRVTELGEMFYSLVPATFEQLQSANMQPEVWETPVVVLMEKGSLDPSQNITVIPDLSSTGRIDCPHRAAAAVAAASQEQLQIEAENRVPEPEEETQEETQNVFEV